MKRTDLKSCNLKPGDIIISREYMYSSPVRSTNTLKVYDLMLVVDVTDVDRLVTNNCNYSSNISNIICLTSSGELVERYINERRRPNELVMIS